MTLIFQDLVARVAPVAVLPNWKQSMLQLAEESKYTKTLITNVVHNNNLYIPVEILTVVACVGPAYDRRSVVSWRSHTKSVSKALCP